MLTGTWLESEKLLAGLFFLLLLLLLLPPPELTVLPPDTFLFRLLLGACLAGSATEKERKKVYHLFLKHPNLFGALSHEDLWEFKWSNIRLYLEVQPFFATFGRGRSSGSLWGSSCRFYVWTSTLAWAPESHKAFKKRQRKQGVKMIHFCCYSSVVVSSSLLTFSFLLKGFAYTEVVECGVGQPTSSDIFSQLIEHLWILFEGKTGKQY